jgi:radical SAM protein with 4Fe4S-binding SPASM domain
MSTFAHRVRTGLRLLKTTGVRGVASYSFHRFKYPYVRLYLRYFPGQTPLSQPQVVQFEISSKCNLRCPSCSLTREITPGRNMNLEEFTALLDRLPFKPASVSLNGIGEALVNPHIFKIIDLLKKRSIACSFYTNGTLLTERVRKEILGRDNIGFVGISCDGASKEVFERLRFGAKFEDWKENVEAFVEAANARRPNPIQLTMSTVVSRDNQHEIGEILDLAADLGFESIGLSDIVPNDETSAAMALDPETWQRIDRNALIERAASRGLAATFSSLNRKPRPFLNCLQPWEYAQISAEGDILPCCAVVGSDKAEVMGNLHTEEFDAIWRGEKLAHFRTTAAAGTNSLCNSCPYY